MIETNEYYQTQIYFYTLSQVEFRVRTLASRQLTSSIEYWDPVFLFAEIKPCHSQWKPEGAPGKGYGLNRWTWYSSNEELINLVKKNMTISASGSRRFRNECFQRSSVPPQVFAGGVQSSGGGGNRANIRGVKSLNLRVVGDGIIYVWECLMFFFFWAG